MQGAIEQRDGAWVVKKEFEEMLVFCEIRNGEFQPKEQMKVPKLNKILQAAAKKAKVKGAGKFTSRSLRIGAVTQLVINAIVKHDHAALGDVIEHLRIIGKWTSKRMIRTTYLDVVVDGIRDACSVIMNDGFLDSSHLAKKVRAAGLGGGVGDGQAGAEDSLGLGIGHFPGCGRRSCTRLTDAMMSRWRQLPTRASVRTLRKIARGPRTGFLMRGWKLSSLSYAVVRLQKVQHCFSENVRRWKAPSGRYALWKYVTLLNRRNDAFEEGRVWDASNSSNLKAAIAC
eukprot:TRINITY_DN4268_c0_g1_i1.p1 TRINITY_DN4268_c0_g1~~TRINITY_DN4268_c0_g1_i1.p1  ORF type:complete len:285 (+),score=24.15 TRINITY_DN4268_c0_g1_i1:276-1130(+)